MNKILIAEENKVIAKLIKNSLLTCAALDIKEENIFFAVDGLEAYETLGKHKDINYVFSEATMPQINGDELVDILVDTGKIDQVSVIFVTADIHRTAISKNYSRNILGIIKKPFNTKGFQEDLARLISDKKAWEQRSQERGNIWEEQGNFLARVISRYLAQNLPEHTIDTPALSEISRARSS